MKENNKKYNWGLIISIISLLCGGGIIYAAYNGIITFHDMNTSAKEAPIVASELRSHLKLDTIRWIEQKNLNNSLAYSQDQIKQDIKGIKDAIEEGNRQSQINQIETMNKIIDILRHK